MRVIHRLEAYLLMLLIGVMTLVTLAQVVFRFLLNSPISWSEELARYLLVWITMIGASVAVARKAHFAMDVVTAFFPDGLRRLVRLFSYLAMGSFAWLMVYYGWQALQLNMVQRSPALNLPMSVPYAAIPVAGALILLHLVDHALQEFRKGDGA